jgi:tetratricopeptide (TPR) repeat protein
MSDTEYPEEFDPWMDEASERMEEGGYSEALPLLLKAAQLVPDDPEVWQRLGATHFALGQTEEAEKAYRRWWEVAPKNPLAFRAYVNLLFRMGHLEEAEAAAMAWLGQEPEDVYALLLIGNARYKRGEEFETWLDRAQSIDPDIFAQVMTQVFDYSRGTDAGEWDSIQAADYLGVPETRLIERAARGGMPRIYDPETETFSFRKDDLDSRQAILHRFELEDTDLLDPDEVLEVDYAADVDDLEEGRDVRVLLQKCPHCGEWTAGPLGDRDRYFCCGAPMDPFVELSSEVEIQGQVLRRAGGGRVLSEGIKRLTPDQMVELTQLWRNGEDWLPRAEEMLNG